jgi:LPXTG-motif cell wall-anchored protein
MKKLPKWFWVESSVIIIFLFFIFIISDAISIVPWKEKYRFYGFYILSGISLIILLISFLYIKKKKNDI